MYHTLVLCGVNKNGIDSQNDLQHKRLKETDILVPRPRCEYRDVERASSSRSGGGAIDFSALVFSPVPAEGAKKKYLSLSPYTRLLAAVHLDIVRTEATCCCPYVQR